MKMMTMKKSQLKSMNYYCPFEILDSRAWTHMTSHVTDDTHSQFNYELMNNYSSHRRFKRRRHMQSDLISLKGGNRFEMLFTVLLSFTT